MADALGAVLTDDVTARYPLPSFDNSAMDGYAVRAADVAAASEDSPVVLPVDGEIAAGDTGRRDLVPGSVIRIMTGAPMPAGADAVVQVELTDGGTERVAIRRAVEAGDAVRLTGGDAQPGDLLLTAGTRLGAVHLGLLAAAGHGTVRARPRPRVTVISTGNELVEPGAELIPGQIWESNATMLAAAAREAGCPARRYPIVRDTTDAVLAAVQDALDERRPAGHQRRRQHGRRARRGQGGAGHTRHRHIPPGRDAARHAAGLRHRRPGRDPDLHAAGQPGECVRLVLPVRPARARCSCKIHTGNGLSPARQCSPGRCAPRRRSDPSCAACWTLRPAWSPRVSGQASHQLASLARANALVIVPEHVTSLDAGETVDVLELP